ncbi:hypothetical protein Ocin01_00773 [Orchesella cincta]|uniref:Uncharacterized protein n=1 Tax=Orchesella cincta TaxID=48709 RepID=A0A1D2NL48_ORCCI|nr:hypothetical protein Ocin01_00773 [Orchesella cincta]
MVQFLPLFGRNSTSCLEYYTIIYMLLIVSQMMLDAAYFQTIINAPIDSETPINIYKCIIIPVHCLQATLQFFFGFDLFKATIKRSYRRAKNWQMVFLCLLAIEVSIFLAYIALATILSVFTYVTACALVFKLYLVWPLRIFMEECQDVCVPLAHAASTTYLVDQEAQARPGPSTSSANKPITSR